MENVQPYVVGNVLLNRFMLIEELKLRVFVAIDSFSGDKVVVKQAEDGWLEREWRCMKQCHSPYIVQPIEYLYSSSLLVLPYLAGQSVLAFSFEQRSLFVSLIPQIVRAINCVHQAGWVHGDIKPSNIIYLPELELIQLIDFGASWPVDTPLSSLNEWQLTSGFSRRSKHQGIGKIEKEDDWYALENWLKQIDDNSLSVKDKRQLIYWKAWLKGKLSRG
ncbi:protein kinase family protein [Photobacterium lipolyticum]|nr:protein kinase family protein [Photobacterium lipolyticum]